MGKRAEQNKKRKRQAGTGINGHPVVVKLAPTTNGSTNGHAEAVDEDPLISQDDLDTTLLTLETLAEDPDELGRKEVKDVKRAVYALQRVMADGSTLGEPSTLPIADVVLMGRNIVVVPDISRAPGLSIHRRPHLAIRDAHS